MSNDTPFPLGRRHAPDERDTKFPMKLVVPRATENVLYRYWYSYRVHLDQTGDTCVANAWTHFLTDSPRTHHMSDLNANRPVWDGSWSESYVSVQSQEAGFRGYLYDLAQHLDEWPETPPEGGTSVRAGAKALQDMGAVKTYHWAQTLDDVINAILTSGPVIVGTEWYNSMFWFDDSGKFVLNVDPSSGVAGGHAWKLDGVNRTSKMFRMKNSWGTTWGDNGFAHISFDALNHLLFERDGEVCIALEY